MAQIAALVLIVLGSMGHVKTSIIDYYRPSNNTCENFVSLTCKHSRDRKYSLYDFVRQRLFYPEGLRPSNGYHIEQKILQQQTDLIQNENSFQDNSLDDLKIFYKQCVGTKSIEFYKSPLIGKILEVCGGPKLFNKNAILNDNLEKIMVNLQRTFSFGPVVSLMMFDKITVTPLYFHSFHKSMIEEVLKALNIEKTDQVNELLDDILKFQSEHTYDDKYKFHFVPPKEMHSADLKVLLENCTVDWYSFIRNALGRKENEDFTIALNEEDIPTVDKVVSRFDKRTIMSYMFFATIVAFESSLDVRYFGEWPAPAERVYASRECLKFASEAKLPFYAQYYHRYIDQQHQKSVEASAKRIKSALVSMVAKSEKIDESTKSKILEKVNQMEAIAEYGPVFKNDSLIQNYMSDMSLSKYRTIFEKYAAMLGKNFRFVTDLARQAEPRNFLWFTDINLDHRLYMRLYATDEKAILIKASMLEEPFYNESSTSNLQLIDWHMIEAFSALTAREVYRSKHEKDIQNQENFGKCINGSDEVDEKKNRRLISDNIFADLALTVFEESEKMTAETINDRLKDTVSTYASQFCGGLKAERFFNQENLERRIMQSMSNFQKYADMFECNEPPKECRIL